MEKQIYKFLSFSEWLKARDDKMLALQKRQIKNMERMTLKLIEKQLYDLFGDQFFQFAFYVDGRKEKNIGQYWVKVETELGHGEYKAWQVRDKDSLEEAWNEIIIKIIAERKTWNREI